MYKNIQMVHSINLSSCVLIRYFLTCNFKHVQHGVWKYIRKYLSAKKLDRRKVQSVKTLIHKPTKIDTNVFEYKKYKNNILLTRLFNNIYSNAYAFKGNYWTGFGGNGILEWGYSMSKFNFNILYYHQHLFSCHATDVELSYFDVFWIYNCCISFPVSEHMPFPAKVIFKIKFEEINIFFL